MSNFKSFLPCIQKKIARKPRFDLFHWVKMTPKWGKSPDHDQNFSSEGGQHTPACQRSGHSSLAFSRKCPEFANLACFTKSKGCQNEENQQRMTEIQSVLKVVRIHQHIKFQAIESDSNKKIRFVEGTTKNMRKTEICNFCQTRNLC